MILIQDGSQPPNIDKPLRIIGDPYKVQVDTVGVGLVGWIGDAQRSRVIRPVFLPPVQQAKEMVNEILRERDHAGFGERNEYGSRMGGGGGGNGINVWKTLLGTVGDVWIHNIFNKFFQWSLLLQIAVPRHSVGVVIGRNGEMIKKIQSDAGVKIQFKPGEHDDTNGSTITLLSCAHRDPTYTQVFVVLRWFRSWF